MHNKTFPSNTDQSNVKENTEPTYNLSVASNTDRSNVKENIPPAHNETVVIQMQAMSKKIQQQHNVNALRIIQNKILVHHQQIWKP